MTRHLRALRIGAAVVVLLVGACGERVDKEAARSAINAAMQDGAYGKDARVSLDRWYAADDYQLSWTTNRRFDAAVAVLDDAVSHGVNPDWYNANGLNALRRDVRETKDRERLSGMAALDVRVTAALLSVGHDVSIGRTDPSTVMRASKRARQAPDVIATLREARDRGTMRGWLDAIAPQHPEYRQLRNWLADLRRADSADPRLDQIAANLERWRWVPDDFGDRHLVVNIPEFMLRAREHDATVLEMRVVVGKPSGHETPMLNGIMESVVFNPYWNIPDSILLAETIPAMTKDRDYLERNDMEVVRIPAKSDSKSRTTNRPMKQKDVDWNDAEQVKQVRVRQRPGGDNALGKIKFPFSNDHLIYLHDTPATALFARDARAFSHGCVRVAEPDVLARYVLSGDGQWTPERISQAVAAADETHAKVSSPLPVHLTYFTVIARPDGQPVYLNDVYGLDRKQVAEWRQERPAKRV